MDRVESFWIFALEQLVQPLALTARRYNLIDHLERLWWAENVYIPS